MSLISPPPPPPQYADPSLPRSRGFGFITFADAAAVDRVLSQDNHILDSRRVEAKRAVPRSETLLKEGGVGGGGGGGMGQPPTPPMRPLAFVGGGGGREGGAMGGGGTHHPHPIGGGGGDYAHQAQPPPLSSLPASSRPSSSSSSSTSTTPPLSQFLPPSLLASLPPTLPPSLGTAGGLNSLATNKIFVGGLHYETKNNDFRSYFSLFGRVLSAEVMFNRETHKRSVLPLPRSLLQSLF